MDTTTLLILAGLGYLLLRQPAAPLPPNLPITQRGGYAITGPGGTVVSIPGIGQYTQLPGQGAAITFDPRLFRQPRQVQGADVTAYPAYAEPSWTDAVGAVPGDPYYGADAPVADICAADPNSYWCY